ncbi:MAG: MMPL family transporter [Luteolibacter sp.]
MRNRLRFYTIFLAVIGLCAAGLVRLRLDTNVLNVLPKSLPAVDALKVSQKYFDNDQQVVLLLESQTDEIEEADAADLATLLREKLAPAKVLYKSQLEEDPSSSARALAALWRQAPSAEVVKLQDRLLDPASLVRHLGEVKNDVSASFDQQRSTMAAYDPLGFLGHPAVNEIIGGDFSFESTDGKSRMLLIMNPNPGNGYKEQAAWLQEVRQAVNAWPGLHDLKLTFRLTGGPVFNAEIGSGMEKDMSGTIMLTSLLIAALFVVVQRDIRQFFLMLVILSLTFVITLGIGGWVYGTLNLVSVGFAAILAGMAIDYPVVVARGSLGQNFTPPELRRAMAPNILWAAATTMLVFGALMLSTFSGVRELGGLLVIGLVAGAIVTMTLSPIFLKRFPARNANQWVKPRFPEFSTALRITIASLLVAAIGFGIKGAPKISFDFSMVDPQANEAASTFQAIQQKFPAWSDQSLQFVANARSWSELRTVAEDARTKLATLRDKGVIENFQWPVSLIPDDAATAANQAPLTKIAAERGRLIELVKANGFSESGVALDSMVLDSLAAPGQPGDDAELTKHFLGTSKEGGFYLAGRVKTKDLVTAENIAALQPLLTADHTLTGWPVLKAQMLPSVKRDFYWLFLPTAGVLFLSLLVVFRDLRDAAVSSVLLIVITTLLNAFAVLIDLPWNFLSGLAIPLIFSTGVDYCIHLIFALRRSNGDLQATWNSAGKAVMFCGTSTLIGFGSLIFASNPMLRSMGIMCSVAVTLTAVFSMLVIPGLWKWSRR